MENFTTSVEIFVQRNSPFTTKRVSHAFRSDLNYNCTHHALQFSPIYNQKHYKPYDVT